MHKKLIEMERTNIIPSEPSIVFAQKATAIVKAAGMDPKLIDLEKFRATAPLIFCKAYCAIYKETLVSEVDENSSKDNLVLNVQCVIDGLLQKTRNPALTKVTGNDIFEGNQKAIGIVVGALFSEGQRLWLQKMKSSNTLTLPLAEMQRGTEESKQHQKDPTNANVSPRELEYLLNRISFLEGKLRKSKSFSSKKSKGKKMSKKAKSMGLENIAADVLMSDARAAKAPSGDAQENHSNLTDDEDVQQVEEDGSSDRRMSGDEITPRRKGKMKKSKSRPASAPSSRRVNQVSSRLYSAHSARQMEELPPAAMPPQPPSPPKVDKTWTGESTIYTYDMRSGRRILISQAEFDKSKRIAEQNGNVVGVTDWDDDLMRGGGGGAGGGGRAHRHHEEAESRLPKWDGIPVKAEWPGKSTGKSVEEYLKKMKKLRHGDDGPLEMPPPKFFAAYQKLQKMDLVISIEHCHNCEHHNISLRHNANDYVKNADIFLSMLSQIVFDSGICARVGVTRIKASITEKSKETDKDSRIGAFEVQLAYCNDKGEIIPEVLHSKLTTRKWPSKMVLEKRFRGFLSKINAAVVARLRTSSVESEEGDEEAFTMATDSIEPYPVGRCAWTDTPLGAAGGAKWTFNGRSQSDAVVSLPNVQWVFDSRGCANPPKFRNGVTVRVSDIIYRPDCRERQCLLGVVKETLPSGDSKSNATRKKLIIRLKYHAEETTVLESQCIALRDFKARNVTYVAEKLPVELEVLLMLAKKEHMLQWVAQEAEDSINVELNETRLCRASFFQQVRKLAWELEQRLRAKGVLSYLHPITNERVDIQLAYSEEVLDWVFNTKFQASTVVMQQLEAMAPALPAPLSLAVPTPTSVTAGSVFPTAGFQQDATPAPSSSKAPTANAGMPPVYPSTPGTAPRPAAASTPLAPSSSAVTVQSTPQAMTQQQSVTQSGMLTPRSSEEPAVGLSLSPAASIARAGPPPNTPATVAAEGVPVSAVTQLGAQAEVTTPVKPVSPRPLASISPVVSSTNVAAIGSTDGTAAGAGAPVLRQDSGKLDTGRTGASSSNNVRESQSELDLTEEEKLALNYQNKELLFDNIVIEGEVLEQPQYQSAMVMVFIDEQHWIADLCLSRERGSKRRSFTVKWPEINLKADAFRYYTLYVSVVISDTAVAADFPTVPTRQNTVLGESRNTAGIPLYKFMNTFFDIKTKVSIPSFVEGKNESILVQIHGHAHEPKESRQHRIMSMRPTELINIKFEPLPIDDDVQEGDDEDYSDDDFGETLLGDKKNAQKRSSKDIKTVKELSEGLFPKASFHNLMGAKEV